MSSRKPQSAKTVRDVVRDMQFEHQLVALLKFLSIQADHSLNHPEGYVQIRNGGAGARVVGAHAVLTVRRWLEAKTKEHKDKIRSFEDLKALPIALVEKEPELEPALRKKEEVA